MDMALDMRDAVAFVKDPRPEHAENEEAHIKIRYEHDQNRLFKGCLYLIKLTFKSNKHFRGYSLHLAPFSSKKIVKPKRHSFYTAQQKHESTLLHTYVLNTFLTADNKIFLEKILKKFVVHIFTFLLAQFVSKLVYYSRHSEY